MLDDSFAHLESKIQAREIEIALLELLDDSQRVKIVIEAVAILAHARVELLLAGMAKRRVADVMHQRESLGEIGVESSAPATVRAICATSSVCVRRLRKWSEKRVVKTCVFASSRRKAREWITRSRSRA